MKGILFQPDVWQGKLSAIDKYGYAETRRVEASLKEINQEPDKWEYLGTPYGYAHFQSKDMREYLTIKPRYAVDEVVYKELDM